MRRPWRLILNVLEHHPHITDLCVSLSQKFEPTDVLCGSIFLSKRNLVFNFGFEFFGISRRTYRRHFSVSSYAPSLALGG